MKILVLSPRPLWPEHDGGTVATARCIRGLASAGAGISVLSVITEKHPEACHSSGEQIPQYLNAYCTVSVDTRIRPAAMMQNLLFSSEPYDLTRFRSQAYSEALRTRLVNDHFDIIHCEGLTMAIYLEEIRELTDSPVVLRAHNLEHKIRQMMVVEELSSARKAYLSNLSSRLLATEKQAAVDFDAVVPISEPDFRWFTVASAGRPVFLSETGAEEAVRMPEPPDTDLRVGFIGSMNWHPNVEGIKWFINKVWPCILEEIPSATLQIAGRGLRQSKNTLPQGKNIVIAGETDDARAFMASSHVIIAPLFAGSGLRIKIIEAMSAGRPVVATPVAADGLKAADGRELSVAGDAASFCSALAALLHHPGKREAMGNAAVTLVKQRYDNTSNTARLFEFYKSLTHDS